MTAVVGWAILGVLCVIAFALFLIFCQLGSIHHLMEIERRERRGRQ